MKKFFRYIFSVLLHIHASFFLPRSRLLRIMSLFLHKHRQFITTPDYAILIQAPSPSALSDIFRSKEGYLFSFDASGRRVLSQHASYVLSAHGSPVPVQYYLPPMIAVIRALCSLHPPIISSATICARTVNLVFLSDIIMTKSRP